ncbi:MAG: thymidine kinase [Gammaproteobacteria bacterium]|nr:MAG: thymidine kinase [Gammaproteobacteria bacterium]RKZ95502.1 MAG: thymidine kinase [Gammaproteobacteria bacterium]
MAKLYFRYGTVGSAKTLNLLSVAHTYREQGKLVHLVKPAIDTRFGINIIKSRAGLEEDADSVLDTNDILKFNTKTDCILVDEVQFFSVEQIEHFRSIATVDGIPVICYGLRTDFRTALFPASKRLLELADSIEEVKNVCHYCNNKSTMNLKHIDGKATKDGPSVELGAEEKYFPVCFSCFVGAFDE